MPPKKVVNQEDKLDEYLTLLMYASIGDILADNWTRPRKVSPVLVKTYQSIMEGNKDRKQKEFTLDVEIAQHLVLLLDKYIQEANGLEYEDDNTQKQIAEKFDNPILDGWGSAIINFSRNQLSPTIDNAREPTEWLYAQTVAGLTTISTKKNLTFFVWVLFERFLKTIAWYLSHLVLYTDSKTVTSGMFCAVLAVNGFSREMIAEIESCVRPRPVKKASPRKKSAEDTADKTSAVDAEDATDAVESANAVDSADAEIDESLAQELANM